MTSKRMVLSTLMVAMSFATNLVAGPKIVAASVKPSCSMVVTNCGSIATATLVTNNGVQIVLDPQTNSFYNAKAPGLTYTIKDAAHNFVTSFTCTKQTVIFHSSKLADETQYEVVITAPTGASPAYPFTTTKPCRGVKIQRK